MTTSANGDWARDPIADANPDLTRKRQRLSEETDQPSPRSSDDSILIEAMSPEIEEGGASIESAIDLADDTNMDVFSAAFQLYSGTDTPVRQLDRLREKIENNYYVEPREFARLSEWMHNHVANTERFDDVGEVYLEDTDFFARLAMLSFTVLRRDDLFENTSVANWGERDMQSLVQQFCDAATILSLRMLALLPGVIDMATTRRDSGQVTRTRQPVDLLWYVSVLAQTSTAHQALGATYFRIKFKYKQHTTSTSALTTLVKDSSAVNTLVAVLQKLVHAQVDITNAWTAIDAILHIMECLHMSTHKEIEAVMTAAHFDLMPAICEKHPRALPDGFHILLVRTAQKMLGQLVENTDVEGMVSLYDRYIKSDQDALLPESQCSVPTAESFREVGENDSKVLGELLNTAWTLQALKSFIYSDIMDVRSIGISSFSSRLLELYEAHTHRDTSAIQTYEHPVLKYIARFMRTNELTKYIFGPNSHASLVNHSRNIVSFLAATSAYTDLETDIIWHACTTSVEAEFVKASFGVLADLSRYLDLDHLLYLANKYTTTPPSKLGKDAIESLTELFHKVQIKGTMTRDRRHRLATAFISIDILMRISESGQGRSLSQLYDIANTELLRFTYGGDFSPDDRGEIYRRCIPNIINPNGYATTSVEIVAMFLRSVTAHQEAEDLLELLPVHMAVRELITFVNTRREEQSSREDKLSAIGIRMEMVVRLMALAKLACDSEITHTFFVYTMGELALSTEARDCAWNMLAGMGSSPDLVTVAKPLMGHFLTNEAVSLPVDSMSVRLMQLFSHALQQPFLETGPTGDDFSLILEDPMWQKLVEAAESTPTSTVTQTATNLICTILFTRPMHQEYDPSIAKCHARFAQYQIDRICNGHLSMPKAAKGSESQLVQQIRLLDAVAFASKQSSGSHTPKADEDVILATEPENELVQYTLQVYSGGHSQPKAYRLQAKDSTTVADLVRIIPNISGSMENRIVVAGKMIELSSCSTHRLSEVGLQASGVIAICPKHSSQSDLSKVLMSPGTIEREVLARYSELEKLLDCPTEIAEQMFHFIIRVIPPRPMPQELVSSDATVRELCLVKGIWRTLYYIHLLRQHLVIFARLGVADENFIRRGIGLLSDIITDERCSDQLDVCSQAMDALTAFLQEHPQKPALTALSPRASKVTARLIDTCQAALKLSPREAIASRNLVRSAFQVLRQASRREREIWTCFTKDDRVVELLANVLLGQDSVLGDETIVSIIAFCADPESGQEVAEFHLDVVLGLLPRALSSRTRATQFFELAINLLHVNQVLTTDESRVREIASSLVATLWQYQHYESTELPVADMAMEGLLRLLSEAFKMVKSFKKPLHFFGLAPRILRELLFPPLNAEESKPLVHRHTRRIAYDLVKNTCESREDFSELIATLSTALCGADMNPAGLFPGHDSFLRPAWKSSGLTNLGMTCYMNSMLQQLFNNVKFRRFIFNVPILDRQKQALLFEVQSLFAHMQDHCQLAADTSGLATFLNIQTDNQEDVHGFYEDFLSRLEANMPDQESRLTLSRFYTGKLLSQIKGECGHISPRTEPFVDLPVNVKNKSGLIESLQEFVQGEPMEGANRYKCLACEQSGGGKLVNAMRRSCPEEIPDNVTFCLKRFTFEAMLGLDGKVNDRFEFPQAIDMSRFHRSHLEDPTAPANEDIFELVGVIVHQGTLQFGHYWSYTLLRNTADPISRVWIKLEDRISTVCGGGVEEVQRECYGGGRFKNGMERADNAYVLFYERKQSLEENISLPGPTREPISQQMIPPRAPIPTAMQAEIRQKNNRRHRIGHLFDEELATLVEWLMSTYNQHGAEFSPQSSPAGDQTDQQTPEVSSETTARYAPTLLGDELSRLTVSYIQRIQVCDINSAKKLDRTISGLTKLMDEDPRLAMFISDELMRDLGWHEKLVSQKTKGVRLRIWRFAITCLQSAREQNFSVYQELFGKFREIYRGPITRCIIGEVPWTEYLTTLSDLARLGPKETAAILDDGYWTWAFRMLSLPCQKAIFDKTETSILELLKVQKVRVSALYDFIHNVLDGHVILPSTEEFSPNDAPHIVQNGGVLLTSGEMSKFVESNGSLNQHSIYHWIQSATLAVSDCAWQESAPGKLLGLLVAGGAPSNLMAMIQTSMVAWIDAEELSLRSIIHLVMHFCSNVRFEEDARPVWMALVKVMDLWTETQGEFLVVIRDAFRLFPRTVLASLEIWVGQFLCRSSSPVIRGDTEKWLTEDVFPLDLVLGSLDDDGTRPYQARKLAEKCIPYIESAYLEKRSKRHHESSIRVMQKVLNYIEAVRDRVEIFEGVGEHEVSGRISAALRCEYDESRTVLTKLHELGATIGDWEPDHSFFTGPADARKSVEMISDALSDEEEDDEGWDSEGSA